MKDRHPIFSNRLALARPAIKKLFAGTKDYLSADRQCRRRIPQGVAFPRDRDEEDAVADQRNRHPRPEDPEVPVSQRRKQVGTTEPTRPVERFVTMLHWRLPTTRCLSESSRRQR